MQAQVRRLRLAGVLASLALLLLTQDALALTWGSRIAITGSRNGAAGTHAFAAASATTGHLVYEEASGGIRRIFYRRSTNGSAAWSTPTQLSANSALLTSAATIGAVGSTLDVAWVEQLAAGNWVVKYRRSTNGGSSWGAEVTLSPTANADAGVVRLIRDAGGKVYVTWTDNVSGSIRLRRSLDGGVTWQSPVGIGTTTNEPATGFLEGWPVVASGTGIVYVAFASSPTTIKLRRSTNGGATWTTATTVASSASGFELDVAAAGSLVVLGFAKYASGHLYTTIRRSTDKGATWKTSQALAPTTGAWSYAPVLSVTGSTVRVLYERDADVAGTKSAAWYRQSTNSGGTWSTATKVSNTTRPYSIPAGLGVTGSTVVVWYDWAPSVLDSDVFVRRGS